MASPSNFNLLGKRNPEDDDLETKQILKKHKETSEEKETTEGLADSLQHNSDQQETLKGLDDTPHFVEEAAVIKNTLFVGNLSKNIKIPEIVDFFKDGGRVVHIRLTINPRKGRPNGLGFIQFASPNETKKALEKKRGEYLLNREIRLTSLAKIPSSCPQFKHCIDHTASVWYEDCLRRDEDEAPSDFAEEVLFVANISPQTKISDIYHFFDDVGVVESVRLIVNHEGKHVGYAFVEFFSSNEAKKVLEKKNGEYLHDHKIFLMKGHGKTPDFTEEVAIRQTKRIFVDHFTPQTMISDIINFFKDVGQVVHVRLMVNEKGKHLGWGFVEFASANEAKKAVEKKNGEIWQDSKIFVELASIDPLHPPEYCIDHKVWFEDYLRQEGLLTEEDEAVEGLTETSDFVEEARKKTLFVTNLPPRAKIPMIKRFFKDVAEVVRVRLIVDHSHKHVGCAFVEFASANQAEEVLEQKNSKSLQCNLRKFFLDEVKVAPYPLQPKYNLAAKLWYEDTILREPNLKQHKAKTEGFCGKKIIFSYDDDD